jgi:hypothetical protein
MACCTQNGAVLRPKRLAADLVAGLIHDIEEEFARGQFAALAILDI